MRPSIAILTACMTAVINAQAADNSLTNDEFVRRTEAGEVQSVELGKYSGRTGTLSTTEDSGTDLQNLRRMVVACAREGLSTRKV